EQEAGVAARTSRLAPECSLENTGLTSLREHLHHHKRDIIHRPDIAAEGCEALTDRVSDLIGRARGTFANHFAQTILAVLLSLRVRRFPHPVRADEENLTGPQRGGSLLAVLRVVHDPQRQIAFPHFFNDAPGLCNVAVRHRRLDAPYGGLCAIRLRTALNR